MDKDKNLTEFLQHKSALMGLSYRMLGSISEAEEVVQDVYIKWLEAKGLEQIKAPRSWLLTVCSNASIDRLGKAYKSREVYSGPWLPEPVLNKVEFWQEDKVELQESLSTAFLLILENLKPIERAVFLLHDIFGYRHREIAAMIGKSEANCRKIAERARNYIESNRPRFDSPSKKDLQTLEQFFLAVKEGDPNEVSKLFSQQPEFWSDGGGKVLAAPKVLTIPYQIGNFFVRVSAQGELDKESYKTEFTQINNRHGLIVARLDQDGWKLETVFTFELLNGKIARIFAVRNPDKLKLYTRKA